MTRWTKIGDGEYRYRDSGYSALKIEAHGGPRWYIWDINGEKSVGITPTRSREDAGVAIERITAAERRFYGNIGEAV